MAKIKNQIAPAMQRVTSETMVRVMPQGKLTTYQAWGPYGKIAINRYNPDGSQGYACTFAVAQKIVKKAPTYLTIVLSPGQYVPAVVEVEGEKSQKIVPSIGETSADTIDPDPAEYVQKVLAQDGQDISTVNESALF